MLWSAVLIVARMEQKSIISLQYGKELLVCVKPGSDHKEEGKNSQICTTNILILHTVKAQHY